MLAHMLGFWIFVFKVVYFCSGAVIILSLGFFVVVVEPCLEPQGLLKIFEHLNTKTCITFLQDQLNSINSELLPRIRFLTDPV